MWANTLLYIGFRRVGGAEMGAKEGVPPLGRGGEWVRGYTLHGCGGTWSEELGDAADDLVDVADALLGVLLLVVFGDVDGYEAEGVGVG